MKRWFIGLLIVFGSVADALCPHAYEATKTFGGMDPSVCTDDNWVNGYCGTPNNATNGCKFIGNEAKPATIWVADYHTELISEFPYWQIVVTCISGGTSYQNVADFANTGVNCSVGGEIPPCESAN